MEMPPKNGYLVGQKYDSKDDIMINQWI